jgi:two-component system, OmpR family, sensor histidine kinase KdpD
MTSERPSPDEWLARVQAEERRSQRGHLKVFFGYAAGVGKTFAMLEAARRDKAHGIDVVVGYVEPHGRVETEALLEGLEALPFLLVPYRGVTLREFDLDAALARKPQLLLVDELAHTNAEGLRHTKRWQDVEELLDAGIDVYTTLNVQHVESVNDVIAQITGVIVNETLPDAVFERADEIELIDITPDELTDRLSAGKVYLAPQAERALESFFQKSNLVALRELSLRQAAHRLRREVDAARQEKSASAPWATSERLLVCVGPSPTTARLLRAAKRMSVAFGCDWLAVSVTTPKSSLQSLHAREQVAEHLRLAERLGAENHTVVGDSVVDAILEIAQSRNVTKIVVGKTAQSWWQRLLRRGIVDLLLEQSGEIDVYVIRGDDSEEYETRTPIRVESLPSKPVDWRLYWGTALTVCVCALVGWGIAWLGMDNANIAMIFLLGVAFAATWLGRGPAITASIVSVLIFDFCFIEPRFSFAVSDAQYLLTFAVMLLIGLLISALTARVQRQLELSKKQERRSDALFRLTRQLSTLLGSEFLIQAAGSQLSELFSAEVVIFLRNGSGVELRFGQQTSIAALPINAIVAEWVSEHNQIAGARTDTLPNATALFVPLVGSQQTVGAIGVKPNDFAQLLDPEQRLLLETCASLIALAIERDQSILDAQAAQVQVGTELLRNSLLSSVSHDLRTPLTTMAGSASSLIDAESNLSESARRELVQSIIDESHRLARLVENLLDITRLESGGIKLKLEWQVLEEIVGSAIHHLREQLGQHLVSVQIPRNFPLVHLDGVLFEQVFVNLLENAARYSPVGSQIDIGARVLDSSIEIRVADNGPGLQSGIEDRVFEKFVRGDSASPDSCRGVGLGLAICRGIVQAHSGSITARNRSEGGAEFVIKLPTLQRPPEVKLDS